MPATTRTRIDWQPGKAALDALQRAKSVLPHLRQQELIDALIVTGLSALVHRWQPPPLLGSDRDRWRLPADLAGQDKPAAPSSTGLASQWTGMHADSRTCTAMDGET